MQSWRRQHRRNSSQRLAGCARRHPVDSTVLLDQIFAAVLVDHVLVMCRKPRSLSARTGDIIAYCDRQASPLAIGGRRSCTPRAASFPA